MMTVILNCALGRFSIRSRGNYIVGRPGCEQFGRFLFYKSSNQFALDGLSDSMGPNVRRAVRRQPQEIYAHADFTLARRRGHGNVSASSARRYATSSATTIHSPVS